MENPKSTPLPLAIDPELDCQVEAFAAAEEMPFGEAHAALLRLGLQVATAQAVTREDRLAAIEQRVNDLAAMFSVIGPPVLGLRRLLAHWASSSGSVQVKEDELVAELAVVSEDEWAAALAGHGVIPALPPVAPEEIH